MAATMKDLRYPVYLDAIRRRICSVCLDLSDDGACGLTDRTCSIVRYLPAVLDATARVRIRRMEEYAAAIDTEVCARCAYRDDRGHCEVREAGTCALHTYLPLIVDTLNDVSAEDAAGATR